MRLRKHEREYKRRRGQYMTPPPLARRIVSELEVESRARILEPSCGDGAFISAALDRLAARESGADVEIVGVEIDPALAEKSRAVVQSRRVPSLKAEIRRADFFEEYLNSAAFDADGHGRLRRESFDLIVGNPPFGGTFDRAIEDDLDARLGFRLGKKIKKETYAFFIVACLDLLKPGGRLAFVCSDSLLTIPTMTGLRNLLMRSGDVSLRDLDGFSDETDYPMLLLDFVKTERPGEVARNSRTIDGGAIRSTPNLSWGITPDLARLFAGPLLGDYFVATSGMTTGKNELFVREIDGHNRISEPYRFEFYDAPITLAYELERARLGKLSAKRRRALETAEAARETERRVRAVRRPAPLTVQLPDPRYRPYNKANNRLLFSHPTHCVYWEDDGDAVLTYKRTGNWYLRGVGGQPHFGREGVTWALVASRFNARYLPPGYILDSGAPCAFARDGVERGELFFVLGWTLTDLANRVLKTAINHTRNIQSKDFERMPYPWWVDSVDKSAAIGMVKRMIAQADGGKVWTRADIRASGLDDLFAFPETRADAPRAAAKRPHSEQLRLPA